LRCLNLRWGESGQGCQRQVQALRCGETTANINVKGKVPWLKERLARIEMSTENDRRLWLKAEGSE
jgi:hypothetical protein